MTTPATPTVAEREAQVLALLCAIRGIKEQLSAADERVARGAAAPSARWTARAKTALHHRNQELVEARSALKHAREMERRRNLSTVEAQFYRLASQLLPPAMFNIVYGAARAAADSPPEERSRM